MDIPRKVSQKRSKIDPAKVLLPLGLGTALSLMGDATMYTVLPTHAAEAGIPLAAVGIILSANRVIRLFLNRPTGSAYDRSFRRRLFLPALLIGAISTAIYAATVGFWPLLAGRLLWGLAWSGIWVGGATIILDVTKDSDRGRWTGWYQTWFFLGTTLGAVLGGWLTDLWGYSTAMWIGAAVTAMGAVFAFFTLPETRPAEEEDSQVPTDNYPEKWKPDFEFYGVMTIYWYQPLYYCRGYRCHAGFASPGSIIKNKYRDRCCNTHGNNARNAHHTEHVFCTIIRDNL